MLKFAYFGVPHTGGTYTVFQSLRAGLLQHGIEVRWLWAGPDHGGVMSDARWQDDLNYGEVIAPELVEDRKIATVIADYLQARGFCGVFVNALCGMLFTNIARYLDPALIRIMIVHTITPGTYAAASTIRDWVHATIGVSPRIAGDLVARHHFRSEWTQMVPNAIQLQRFANVPRRTSTVPLRVLFLGRVEDTSKGVFWLPRIMNNIVPERCFLTVVGDGPDLESLRRKCRCLDTGVRFLGAAPREQVPWLFGDHDIYLFPSRYEGLGLSLVEAMATGCVPVASHIAGVTDFLVEDGHNGFLFPVGDTRSAARCVRRLVSDPGRLQLMSRCARESVWHRFGLDDMAAAYAGLIRRVREESPPIARALPLDRWHYPAGLRRGVRSFLPASLKKLARQVRERARTAGSRYS